MDLGMGFQKFETRHKAERKPASQKTASEPVHSKRYASPETVVDLCVLFVIGLLLLVVL